MTAHPPRRRITKAVYHLANERTRLAQKRRDQVLEQAKNLTDDPGKADREERCLCLTCFYIPERRVVMHAFTDWTCRLCGNPDRHPNSGVPIFCLACAHRLHACARCGAEQSLSSTWPPPGPLPPRPTTRTPTE